MILLSIDPGTELSAYAVMDMEDYRIIAKGKIENEDMLSIVKNEYYDDIAIEMIASYGMPVGREVFETVLLIGRMMQIAYGREIIPNLVYRKDVKINLCGSTKAKDGNIRQALIDRFGVVGTKGKQGWFFGVSKDIWAAISVGVTHIDEIKKQEERK